MCFMFPWFLSGQVFAAKLRERLRERVRLGADRLDGLPFLGRVVQLGLRTTLEEPLSGSGHSRRS